MKTTRMRSSTLMHPLCLLLCIVAAERHLQQDPSISQDDAYLQCETEVQHYSAEPLPRIIEGLKIKFLHMALKFPAGINVSETELAVQPLQWYWSYTPLKGSYPYFQWPWDFSILSIGLLDTYSMHYNLYLDVSTPNCSMKIGTKETNFAISSALANMTTTYLTGLKQYNYSYWCYMEEYPHAKDTLAYTMGVYMGYPAQIVGYRCCQFKFEEPKRERYLKCWTAPMPQWQSLMVIPFVLSIILLLYSPLLLMEIASCMSRSCYVKEDASKNGYTNLDVSDNDAENEPWVVLSPYCPISVSTIVCGFNGLVEKHPVLTSRLRRAIFLLLAPVFVYVKILAHFYLQYDLSMELIRHGAPLGFISMIAGISESRRVFLTNLGGPYLVMLCYYILGFILFVVPKDLSVILEDGVMERSSRVTSSIFGLDLDTIQNISLVSFTNRSGYSKVLSVLAAQCLMLVRFKYWNLVLKIQVQRWEVFSAAHLQAQDGCSRVLYVVLRMLGFVTYLFICVLEITTSTLYFALPVFPFIIYVIRGFAMNFSTYISSLRIGYSKTSCYIVFRFFWKLVFSACLIYFVICFCEIIGDSFIFFVNIICFTYISGMVFPDDAFGYLFFGAGFFYYICNSLSNFGRGYHDLLNTTIAICEGLSREHSNIKVDGNTLILPQISQTVNEFQIHGIAMKLTSEQQKLINNAHPSPKHRYIRRFNVQPAIRKSLFLHVIKKHRPIHIHLLFTSTELLFICVLVYVSLTVLNKFYFTRDTSGVIKVLTILVMGMLPQIVKSIRQDKQQAIERSDERAHIEQTVIEHFEMISFMNNSTPMT